MRPHFWMRASFFDLGYPQWSLFLEDPAKECIMMAGHGRSGMMMHTFASVRDDEGLRESGCHVRHVLMSPPNNTPSEHETVRGLFPLAVTLAIRHATAIVLSQMPMARVPRLPSTDYWLIHVPPKAKSFATIAGKGLLPCGFTTRQIRDRGVSDGRLNVKGMVGKRSFFCVVSPPRPDFTLQRYVAPSCCLGIHHALARIFLLAQA